MPEEIHILDHKVRLLQPERGFRTSMDAVLLAAACPAKGSERVLDLGCGIGSAALCLLWREPDLRMSGLDLQQAYIDLAVENCALNKRQVTLHCADMMHFRVSEPAQRFDHIICNPPFYDASAHTPSPIDAIAAARGHQDQEVTLQHWTDCALQNLQPRGSITLIHAAQKLDKIIMALGKKFGATDIIPIYTIQGEPAKRVIVRSYKDRHGPCRLLPPVTLKDVQGVDTVHARSLLRSGHSFDTLYADFAGKGA